MQLLDAIKFAALPAESVLRDLFEAATELPEFQMVACSFDTEEEWRLAGWSLDHIHWQPDSVVLKISFRAVAGGIAILLPVFCEWAVGVTVPHVSTAGEVGQTDEVLEALRANVVAAYRPQAVRAVKNFGAIEIGAVYLLDARRGLYVRVVEGELDPARSMSPRALACYEDCFEALTSWPQSAELPK